METVAGGETRADAESRRRWTLVVFAFVALEGASLQMQGAVVPILREAFGTPEWQLGLVAPAGTLGFVLTVAVVGAVVGRVGTRRPFLLGVLGTGLGLLVMGLAPSFAFFLAALLARGTFSGVGRGTDRPLLSHLYPRRRGRLFSFYDMMWAVGATVGPLVVALAVRLGDWRLAYLALAAAFVPLAAAVWRLPTPAVGGDDPLSVAELRRVLRDPRVLLMTVGVVLSTGVEGGLFTWLTTYAEGRLPGALSTASLSVLLAAYVPGRLASGWLAERVGSLRLTVGLVAGCLCALAYTLFLAEGLLLLVGLFAVGATLSGQFPTLLAYATDSVPEHSAPVNALSLVVSAGGIAGVPVAMGFVIDAEGVVLAMRLLLVPLALLFVVLAASWVVVGRTGS